MDSYAKAQARGRGAPGRLDCLRRCPLHCQVQAGAEAAEALLDDQRSLRTPSLLGGGFVLWLPTASGGSLQPSCLKDLCNHTLAIRSMSLYAGHLAMLAIPNTEGSKLVIGTGSPAVA